MPTQGISGPQAGVIWGICLHILVIIIGVLGFSSIESWPLLDSFYMTIISITTVGYREVNPLSSNGRLFTSFVIVAGLGTAFYTTTMLGRVILAGEFRGTMRRRHMKNKIGQLRDHSIVCGFGRMGHTVADELSRDGFPFCVIELDGKHQAELEELGYLHIIGDSTEESLLKSAGIGNARTVLALLGSDADNLYLTMMAKDLNPRVKVVARALDEMAERRLQQGGADNVVAAYKIAGLRVIHAAVRPTINEFIDLVTDREKLSLVMEEVAITKGSTLIGSTLEEAAIRSNYGVIVVATKKTSGEMMFNPAGSTVLAKNDILIAMGEESSLRKLQHDCKP